MVKKMMVLVLVSIISALPMIALAGSGATQMAATAKVSDSTPVIRLASNDVVQMQEAGNRSVADKKVAADGSAAPLSKIPPQAWLILTALFCFVMRSSRRTV